MLSKLEQAVEKISESNQNISQILIRHEERIDRSAEANDSILALLDKNEQDLKGEIERQDKKFTDEIGKHETKIKSMSDTIEELKKNRWIIVGAVIASSFFLNQLKVFDRLFSPPQTTTPTPLIRYAGPSNTLSV